MNLDESHFSTPGASNDISGALSLPKLGHPHYQFSDAPFSNSSELKIIHRIERCVRVKWNVRVSSTWS